MTPSVLRTTRVVDTLKDGSDLCIRVALATAERDEALLVEIIEALLEMDRSCQEAAFEVVLQTHLFSGFPKTIFALRLMQKGGLTCPPAADHQRESAEIKRDGEALCAQIYGPSYEPLREMMASLHPDFDTWMVTTGYGRVLSRPGLAAHIRELAVLPVLAAQGAWPQLQSHVAGARRCGASVVEVWWALSIWAQRADDEMVETAIRHTEKALARV